MTDDSLRDEPNVPQQREYADPIDEDALHDQLMIAIASEEAAFDALPDQYPPGVGIVYPLDDGALPEKASLTKKL
jgi:hypothetical protein